MKGWSAVVTLLAVNLVFAQSEDTLQKDTTCAKSFQMHIGFDWYYAANISDRKAVTFPFFVSFTQNREIQQNLIYADLKWDSKRFRGRIIPAIGTFMQQNSAAEKGIFRNLLEANLGIKLFKSKDLWLDAGILGSPYTNENPYSQEHLSLTRSLAAEYVPYYLAGARASWQIDARWKASVYLLNGWQQIHDINGDKSLGTQLEFKPTSSDVFNWNTYIGKEGVQGQSKYGMRYFTDLFWTHGFSKQISIASCVYAGLQRNTNSNDFWWQGNTAVRFTTRKFGFLSIRSELFYDPHNVVVANQIPGTGFHCFAYSVGYGYHLLKSMLLRVEYRRLLSTNKYLYLMSDASPKASLDLLTTALTFWF